jgi:hypothetical protein
MVRTRARPSRSRPDGPDLMQRRERSISWPAMRRVAPGASGPERGQQPAPASRPLRLFGPDRDGARVNHCSIQAHPVPERGHRPASGVPPAAVVRPGSRRGSRQPLLDPGASGPERGHRPVPAVPPAAVVGPESRLASRQSFLHTSGRGSRACRRLWSESARPPKCRAGADSQDHMDQHRGCPQKVAHRLTGHAWGKGRAVRLTFYQPTAPTLPWLDGPCDPGNPCAGQAARRSGRHGSQGIIRGKASLMSRQGFAPTNAPARWRAVHPR